MFLIIGIFLILLGLFLLSFKTIFYLSYISVQVNCLGLSEKELNDLGYEPAGVFTTNGTKQEIRLFTDDPKVLKHELCHKDQFDSGRLYTCKIPTLRFINEVECNIRKFF